MTEQIYVVKGTRYECGDVYPELGSVETRILEYATGDPEEIRRSYNGKGFMKVEVEPVEINDYGSHKVLGRAWSSYLEVAA